MITLLWVIVYILVLALVCTLLWWALGLIPVLPPNVKTLIVAIVAVIGIIYILTLVVGELPPPPRLN